MQTIPPPQPIPLSASDEKFLAQCRRDFPTPRNSRDKQVTKSDESRAMEAAVRRLERFTKLGAGTAQVAVVSVWGSDTSEPGVHITAGVTLVVRLVDLPAIQYFLNVLRQTVWKEADPSFEIEVGWDVDWTCATTHDMVADGANWASLTILIGAHEIGRTAEAWAVDLFAESWERCRSEMLLYDMDADAEQVFGEPGDPMDDQRQFYLAPLRLAMDETVGLLEALNADRRNHKKEQQILKAIFAFTQQFLDNLQEAAEPDDDHPPH